MGYLYAFIDKIGDVAFINNLLLILFFIVFGLMFLVESRSKESRYKWVDLITDTKTGKFSLTKFGQFIAVVVSTWVVITFTQIKESYTIFPLVFLSWLAFVSGVWAFKQWLSQASNMKIPPSNKDTE